jgi:hypothetical protein
MSDANHVGDRDDMVVGDNDHGDAVPQCGSCGVAWVDHMGIMGVCAENAQLREDRDEARRQVCEFEMVNIKCAHDYATYRGWDCYKKKETL